ncbi:hypothetical protein N7G274_007042 [Stereocaulon virgatum]|uniref:DUF7587 domain-containing protein n=1 Tax=Stereocaulon virgatum TaxID=373712 RepID=A0ABR4A2H4_9LECA
MWYVIQRKSCSKTARELLHSTSAPFSSTSSGLVDQAFIEKITIDLRIQLMKGVPEPVVKSPKPVELQNISRKRKVVQSDSKMTDTETSFSSIKSQTDMTPSTPKRRRNELVLETPEHSIAPVSEIGLLTPLITRTSGQQSQLPERKKLPRIAFPFVDSLTIPPPPSLDDPYYRDEALRHVVPVASGPTPLISVTRNLVRTLHRALKMGPTSFITIIDLHKADREGRVQSATISRLQVDHLYRPSGEIWGGIDAAAIISVVGLPELLPAMPAMPSDADPFRIETMRANQFLMPVRQSFRDDPLPVSFHADKAVGELLHALSIPAEGDLCEAAVHSFLADWTFEGRSSNWRANTSFRSGVEQAYREKQSEKETPLIFKELAERATKIVDERVTEEDYDLDRAANVGQATEDFPGYTCGESVRLDPDELVVSAVAIKEEHDSLDNNTHRIAWSNFTFDSGRDAAEEAETEQYTRIDHISDQPPSLNDDEAFITDSVSKLQDFVNA